MDIHALQFGWPVYKVWNEAAPSVCCVIPKTEERGITPRQLLVLWEYIKVNCVKKGWNLKDWNNKLLTAQTVTLYDCNSYVIKPICKRPLLFGGKRRLVP